MDFNLCVKTLGIIIIALGLGEPLATAQSTYFVFVNNTGVPDDAVYVNLTAADNAAGLYSGDGTALSVGSSYTLQQLKGALPGGPSSTSNVPIFKADTYWAGAQINITLGQATGNQTPPGNIVSGLVEEYVVDGSGTAGANQLYNNNIDTSYVNGISMPVSVGAYYRNQSDSALNGTAIPFSSSGPLNTVNPIATPVAGSTTADIFNSLNNDPFIPSQAVFSNSYAVKDSSGNTVGTISGTMTILSSHASVNGIGYGQWPPPPVPRSFRYQAPFLAIAVHQAARERLRSGRTIRTIYSSPNSTIR